MPDINIAITREKIDKDDIIHFNQHKFKNKINIITLPTIITTPITSIDISNAIKKIENRFYNYYIFASSNSVNIFFKAIEKEKNSQKIIQDLIELNENNTNFFIAIGPKTKSELERNNIKTILDDSSFYTTIDKTYSHHSVTSLGNNKADYSINNILKFLDKLDKEKEKEKEKTKVLMPRSAESLKSNNFITKIYKNLILDQVFFYESREFDKVEESTEWKKFKEIVSSKKILYMIFTSPSTVRSFFNIIAKNFLVNEKEHESQSISNAKNDQELLNNLGIRKIISLGPKTSEELNKRHISFIESKEHTIKGALTNLVNLID